MGICVFGKLSGKNIWKKYHLRCDLKDEKELANKKKKDTVFQAKETICEDKRECGSYG